MGLFDRVLKPSSDASKSPSDNKAKDSSKEAGFYLDADSSMSVGNVNYMRESKTIRHTFPGTVDNPGLKELVTEVDASDTKIGVRTDGLGGQTADTETNSLQIGVQKKVKKTFAETMSAAEFSKRLRNTNVDGANAAYSDKASAPIARKSQLKPTDEVPVEQKVTYSDKPGSIDPFRAMVKDL